ncbi:MULTISPECIES: DUF4416 family protein [Calditerrivibrio]|uniref:DUF4416 domain-containing protein n=1 Tax=Calditerrivibrio nitroreducens TaxID=477976 RepID=A0A2J6WJJ0_9BACT|nr:MAG: DUF4416 domain-containing protein [Calditerrivibrio nitroreducens]
MVYGGGVRRPQNVILFNAVMFNPDELGDPLPILEKYFGEVFLKTSLFAFEHTDYYNKEFGSNLYKCFVAHRKIIQPDRIVEMKLKAVEIEDMYKKDGKRRLNLDPGYVAIEKVVAASTKNFTHRIYIGRGIYGDLQLSRRGDRYEPHPWTFFDYKLDEVIIFFDTVRKNLMEGVL